jgi:tetratricopeptide (TPR) repeat protein
MEIGIFDVQVESFSRDLALAHVRRGYGHYRTGDLTAALSEFLEAKRLCPDDPYVHYLLGKTLARFGRPREAQSSLRECLALCPRFLDAHYQLGRAYLAEKDANLTRALAAFEGEIAVYSAHAEAHRAIAKIQRQLGNRSAATESRRRAAVHGYRRRERSKAPLKSVA